jgi:TolB-like protein
MSADPEQEYFSDGISEELLNVLAKLPGLRVAARTSSFQFKGQHEDIAEIAAALNVAHILEGSVRKSGNKLRITAQLIKADDGFHLWSETYDRELDDVFTIQNEIAGAISDALEVKLALVAGEAVQPTVIKAASTAAYDAYLQGRELINRRGPGNMQAAARHFERALRLDENFAPAHALLAIAMNFYGWSLEARRSGIAHLDRAQELEPDLAEAHAGRAYLANRASDHESAIEHARKALASNPSYVDAMNWLSGALSSLGRTEEAVAIFEQMLVIDPLSVVGRLNYAGWLQASGQFEEAHELADQLLAQSPWAGYRIHAETSMSEGKIAESLTWALRARVDDTMAEWAFLWAGEYDEARRFEAGSGVWINILEGRWDSAIRAAQENLQRNPDSKGDIEVAADTLFYTGRIEEALPLYERLLDLAPEGRPIPVFWWQLPATMRLALARRESGDEPGAQVAAQIVRQELAANRAAGNVSFEQDLTEAMLAAFEHDVDHAIAALQSATQRGLRFWLYVDEPVFDLLRDDPRFVALRQELDVLIAVEHDKVLQLICFNNPVPEDWQPMPETCEGVMKQSGPAW